jgi:putative PIN family toxin of toxin-antitoxin system
VKAVLDPNVIISALLTPAGTPAKVLRAWLDGAYELFASALLLAELRRALGYPKLRERITEAEASALIDLLLRQAQIVEDPASPPALRSPDPGDGYLLALAEDAHAVLVSGDGHLLGMGGGLPICAPGAFLEVLDAGA